ncbi:MAG TPA: glycosyltransferase [Candidatus Bathyarchaeia archaeon]|nr:glycosyltransferase [Candidatus Bathyarchaeia archaeon]
MKPRLIAFLNSYRGSISGGDIRFVEIARRMKKVEKIVITPSIGRKMLKSEGLNARYFITSKEVGSRNILISHFERILKALFLDIEIHDGDILYSTSDFLPDVLPIFVLKLKNRNAKWIAMVHHRYGKPWMRKGNTAGNWLGYFSQQISFWLIKKQANSIFVYDSPEGAEIQKYFENASKKTFAVENGVDFKSINNEPEQDKRYAASFAAELRESKGVLDLIRIWRVVCEEQKEFELVIAGSGEKRLENKMKDLIKDFGLTDNLTMLGYVPHNDIFKILKMSKLFVFPSFEEGWGIAICEAMACGLPVVAWDLPVYRGIFPKGMIRIPPGNINEFAYEILNLLKNETFYDRISKDAFKTASKYDWDKIAERELELLKETLKN